MLHDWYCYPLRGNGIVLCDASFGYFFGVGVRCILVLLSGETGVCLKLVPHGGISEHITFEMSQSETRV